MIQSKPLIILGSSRSSGDTFKALQTLFASELSSIPLVDLNELSISYYDYAHRNIGDDFIPLAEKMVTHNPLILATPVYWYTMSAIMKTFIDRFTDLLDIKKDLGRKLRGKSLFVVTAHHGEFNGFEDAFRQTAHYLGMHYGGCFYFNARTNDLASLDQDSILAFRNKLFAV